MAYGLEWRNAAGALTISSEQYGLVSIGNATYAGAGASGPFYEFGSGGDGGWIDYPSPFRVYNITSVGTPLVFLQLINGYYFIVCSITNTSGNNWQITVAGNNWSATPILKCFSRLQGPGGSGYGLRVFDAFGNRTWDTTELMLVMNRRDVWAADSNGTNSTISQSVVAGISAPYLFSLAETYVASDYCDGTTVGVYYTIKAYISGWTVDGSNNISRISQAIYVGSYRDSGYRTDNNFRADRSYVIAGAKYP
jgi:hypothetical protein